MKNKNIFGCHFHSNKYFLKNVGEFIVITYNNEANFCVPTKTTIALVLNMAANELADELPDELMPLVEWFEEFYIGKKNRRIGQRKPR